MMCICLGFSRFLLATKLRVRHLRIDFSRLLHDVPPVLVTCIGARGYASAADASYDPVFPVCAGSHSSHRQNMRSRQDVPTSSNCARKRLAAWRFSDCHQSYHTVTLSLQSRSYGITGMTSHDHSLEIPPRCHIGASGCAKSQSILVKYPEESNNPTKAFSATR